MIKKGGKIMDQFKIKFKEQLIKVTYREEIEMVEEKTIYVTVDGLEFDGEDLLSTLENIRNGDIEITNRDMCEHLKKIEVVGRCGSRRAYSGATEGVRFNDLYKQLQEIMYRD